MEFCRERGCRGLRARVQAADSEGVRFDGETQPLPLVGLARLKLLLLGDRRAGEQRGGESKGGSSSRGDPKAWPREESLGDEGLGLKQAKKTRWPFIVRSPRLTTA